MADAALELDVSNCFVDRAMRAFRISWTTALVLEALVERAGRRPAPIWLLDERVAASNYPRKRDGEFAQRNRVKVHVSKLRTALDARGVDGFSITFAPDGGYRLAPAAAAQVKRLVGAGGQR